MNEGENVNGPVRGWWRSVGWALVSLLILATTVPTAAAGHSHKTHHRHHASSDGRPMRNFGVVWERKLTRSGMPEADSGWAWLRAQGVRTVVTFREENDVDYARLGFRRTLHIPLSSSTFPSEQQAQEFLAFIQDSANQPVHIHCKAGRDRTGMMAALARYAVDGWPLDTCLAEARTYRGGKSLETARIRWLEAWAGNHPPGAARLRNVPAQKP